MSPGGPPQPELLALLDDRPPPAPDWCFFIGGARTGSTIAAELLSRHPEALMLNEVWLWGYVDAMLHTEWQLPYERTTIVRNTRLLEATMPEFGVSGGWRASMLRRVLEQFRPQGLRIFGDKRNAYTLPEHFPIIMRVFPGCRLVATTRGVLDRVASFLNWQWWSLEQFGHLSPRQRAVQALASVLHQDAVLQGIMRTHTVHEVSFERMAEDAEAEWAACLEFLDLPADSYPFDSLRTTWYGRVVGRWREEPLLRQLVDEMPEFAAHAR